MLEIFIPERLYSPDPDEFVKAAIGEIFTAVEPEHAKS
jgi:hypothetical protein